MTDLIERDEALRLIAEEQAKAKYGMEDCALYRASKIVRELPAANSWIPCSERLPKSVGNKVLVFCTGEDVNDYVGFGHYEVFKNIVTWYNLETSLPFADWGLTVTHWMPLPEPPESGAQDEAQP